jgi:hypothetical protein
MASRNRVIYQSEGLYISEDAGSTLQADHEQVERVQSANYSYTINRQDVNQYGELARIDSIVLEPPTVSVDFTYLLTDGFNERCLGFFVQNTGGGAGAQRNAETAANQVGNFASGHMVAHSGQNIFIVTGPDGEDLNEQGALVDTNTDAARDTVIGIGNCYISDYSIDLSVGALPTASVTMEGANVRSSITGKFFQSPAIDQEDGSSVGHAIVALPDPATSPGGGTGTNGTAIVALRPGDITLGLTNVSGETTAELVGNEGAHIQSCNISIPLSRSPLERLGSKFPFARSVDFPVNVTMSVSAIVNQTDASNLVDVLDSGAQTISVRLKSTNADTVMTDAMRFELKGAKLESESYSSSIGSNKTVDLVFNAQVAGPNDTDNGLFVSGANAHPIFA